MISSVGNPEEMPPKLMPPMRSPIGPSSITGSQLFSCLCVDPGPLLAWVRTGWTGGAGRPPSVQSANPGELRPGACLLQQGQGDLRGDVGLGEDGDAGLLQDLRPRQGCRLGRDVDVADARVGCRDVLDRDRQVVDRRL